MNRSAWILAFLGYFLAVSAPAGSCPSAVSANANSGTGQVSITVTLGGSCGYGSGTLYLDGAVLRGFDCDVPGPCQATFQMTSGCMADGSHAVRLASSCSTLEPGPVCAAYTGAANSSFNVNNQPTVSVSASQTTTPAIYHASVPYGFPGTCCPSERSVTLTHIDPSGTRQAIYSNSVGDLTQQNGSVELDINTECWAEGIHTLEAVARVCNGDSQTKTAEIQVRRTPSIDISIIKHTDGTSDANVGYSFPENNNPSDRDVLVQLLPKGDLPGGTFFDANPPQASGTFTIPLGTFDSERLVRATGAGCSTVRSGEAGVEPNCCPVPPEPPHKTGDPVRLWDGEVSYEEQDPLPADIANSFHRTYSSSAGDGLFGVGWISSFDAGITVANNRYLQAVVVETENHHRFVFNLVGGAWLQDWPKGVRALSTLAGSETAGYQFREAGSSLVRQYGTNHKLTSYLDLRRNRQTIITYDASKLPTRIYDDGGAWSCSVVTAGGHVTQLSVDGNPGIVWNYGYAGSLLQSVSLAGAPTPWRSYSYSSNRLARSATR
jgi:hypothetical protein